MLKVKQKIKNRLRSWLFQVEQDIELANQRIATQETVGYIRSNFKEVIAFNNKYEIYDYVAKAIDISSQDSILEFGVYKAESINYLAKIFPSHALFGFDSFEGLPEYWRIGFDKSSFNINGTLPKVAPNIKLYKGWFQEGIPIFLNENNVSKIALLHIDCDLYSSTVTVFEMLGHLIQDGTIIIFDEYFNYPDWQNHEYKAFQEFVQQSNLNYKYLAYNQRHEQVVVKIIK